MKLIVKTFNAKQVNLAANNDFSKWSNPDLAIKLNEILDPDKVDSKISIPSVFRKFIKSEMGVDLSEKMTLKEVYAAIKSNENWSRINDYNPSNLRYNDIPQNIKDLANRIFGVLSQVGIHGSQSEQVAKDYILKCNINQDRYFNFHHRGYSYKTVRYITMEPNKGTVNCMSLQTRKDGRKVNIKNQSNCKNEKELAVFINDYCHGNSSEINECFKPIEDSYKAKYVPEFVMDASYFLDSFENKPRIIAISLGMYGKMYHEVPKLIDGLRSYKAGLDYLKKFYPDEPFILLPFSGSNPSCIWDWRSNRYQHYLMLDGIEGYKSYIGGRQWLDLYSTSECTKKLAECPLRYGLNNSNVFVNGSLHKVIKEDPKYIAICFDFDEISNRAVSGPRFSFDFSAFSYENHIYHEKIKTIEDAMHDYKPSLFSVSKQDGNYILKLEDGVVPDFMATQCLGLKDKPKVDTKAELDVESVNKLSDKLGKGDGYYIYTCNDGNGFVPVAGPYKREELKDWQSDSKYQLALYSKSKNLKVPGTKKYPLHTNRHMMVGFFRYYQVLNLDYKDFVSMKQVPTASKCLYIAKGIGRIGKTVVDKEKEVKYILAWNGVSDYKVMKVEKVNNLFIVGDEDVDILGKEPTFMFLDSDPKFGTRPKDLPKLRYVSLRMFKKSGLFDDGVVLEDCKHRGYSWDDPKENSWKAYNRLSKAVYHIYNDGDHPWRREDYRHDIVRSGMNALSDACKDAGIRYPGFSSESEKDFFAAFDMSIQLIFRGL